MADVTFSPDEIETIKRFLKRFEEWIGGDDGITGFDDSGVIVTEYDTEYSYGETYLERTPCVVPWVALTDPEAYAVQKAAENAERDRQYADLRRELARKREVEERKMLEALKAKYGA